MAAITQPLTNLIANLRSDFPEIKFVKAEITAWDPTLTTVFFEDDSPAETILHELGHGLLAHADYHRDIELLALERDAWQKAKSIAGKYRVAISSLAIEDHLDTYRDWLHARSTCPVCESTGLEDKKGHYRCLTCQHGWRVNQARTCGLKRISDTKIPR